MGLVSMDNGKLVLSMLDCDAVHSNILRCYPVDITFFVTHHSIILSVAV